MRKGGDIRCVLVYEADVPVREADFPRAWTQFSSKALILFLVDSHPNMHIKYKFEEESKVRSNRGNILCTSD